jgi:hypothetical protein
MEEKRGGRMHDVGRSGRQRSRERGAGEWEGLEASCSQFLVGSLLFNLMSCT